MQEIFLDTGDWLKFWEGMTKAFEDFPFQKRVALEKAGVRIRQEVREAIDASGVNDRFGRVKRWQEPHVGTKGGYVAVRAEPGTFIPYRPTGKAKDTHPPTRLAYGALTNYLNSGHEIYQPVVQDRRRRRYVFRRDRTRAFRFYQAAEADAKKIAVEEIEAMLQALGIQISRGG